MGSSEFCFCKFAWNLRIVFLFSPFPHYQHLSVTDSNNAFKITSLLEVNFNPEDDTFRQPVESFYYGVCTRNPSTLWIIHWRWKSNHLKHARWTASNVQNYIVRIIFRSHRTGKCDLCCPRNLQIILLSLIFYEKDRLASWWRWCLCWKKSLVCQTLRVVNHSSLEKS